MLGYAPLFQFRHGDHLCVFYRSEEDLLEVLTPYIAEGLLKGERCFCAQKAEVLKRLSYDLRFLGIDPDNEIKRGALELHTEEDTYLPNKRFEPQVMMDMLTRSIRESSERGFTAFRTAGEMSWAVRGRNECDNIVDYEAMVDQCYPGKPAIGLCQYAMGEFSPDLLNAVLQTHRLHLAESKTHCMHSSLHVRFGSYSAEVVADKFVVDPRFYYVVQQQHPRKIVGWGVAPTFDRATTEAEHLAAATA